MRNDALQNNLVQLLKYLAESFDNLEFQKTKKVAVFKTKIVTSSIAGQFGLFTFYLMRNDMKHSEFGNYWILYMYTVGAQW